MFLRTEAQQHGLEVLGMLYDGLQIAQFLTACIEAPMGYVKFRADLWTARVMTNALYQTWCRSLI